jgi:hypothetical protein
MANKEPQWTYFRVLGAGARDGFVETLQENIVRLRRRIKDPNFTIRILRFVLILTAGILGLYGVMLVFIMLTAHLVKLKSFGVPYTAPFAPYRPSDWKDLVLRLPVMAMKKRPEILKTQDKKRQ